MRSRRRPTRRSCTSCGTSSTCTGRASVAVLRSVGPAPSTSATRRFAPASRPPPPLRTSASRRSKVWERCRSCTPFKRPSSTIRPRRRRWREEAVTMTEITSHPRLFNRREFLAGTGALVVAIGAPRLLNPKAAVAALDDFPIGPALVDPQQVDSWLGVQGNGTVIVYSGKVELGTGVSTTAMQLVADELDVPFSKVKVIEGDTWWTVDQGFTAGSQSNKTQYAATGAIRQAAAEARLALLNLASKQLGAPVAQLTVKDGVVSVQGDSTKSVSYGQLIGDKRFDLKITGKAVQMTSD